MALLRRCPYGLHITYMIFMSNLQPGTRVIQQEQTNRFLSAGVQQGHDLSQALGHERGQGGRQPADPYDGTWFWVG